MVNQKNNSKQTILIVDDHENVRRSLTILLQGAGYLTYEAETVKKAAQILSERCIDLAIVDLRLGEKSGIDVIRYIQERHPDLESILVTAYGSIESSVEAMQAGASDYITKPFSNSELLLRVGKALERKRLKEEIITLRQHVAMNYGFDNIVGISKQITQVKETAKRIAPTDITILISGASGTGKELFARAIHHHSHRRNGPFVAIDCSAIPETLLESELFGHTKGSFTSASTDKVGLFEQGDGGTVFLDEVGNMAQSVQVKLLRFLQDSVVRKVGSDASRRVNTRIIAATNSDLVAMIGKGEFREDLYYRLNVIPLHLPTLVERAEDIEIFTEYFLRKLGNELDHSPKEISRAAVDKLLSHNWPGNVRELENTLKRASALCTSSCLEPKDITFISNNNEEPKQPFAGVGSKLHLKGRLLDNSQRSLIFKALNDNNWNYTKTASELGIGRTTLWRKVKKYDLKRDLVSS